MYHMPLLRRPLSQPPSPRRPELQRTFKPSGFVISAPRFALWGWRGCSLLVLAAVSQIPQRWGKDKFGCGVKSAYLCRQHLLTNCANVEHVVALQCNINRGNKHRDKFFWVFFSDHQLLQFMPFALSDQFNIFFYSWKLTCNIVDGILSVSNLPCASVTAFMWWTCDENSLRYLKWGNVVFCDIKVTGNMSGRTDTVFEKQYTLKVLQSLCYVIDFLFGHMYIYISICTFNVYCFLLVIL